MNELFDPANFIWIIPLCAFGAFIICMTCVVLRKEIKNFFKKLFFPYRNRYSIPAGIITKDSQPKSSDAAKETAVPLPLPEPIFTPEGPVMPAQKKEEKSVEIKTEPGQEDREEQFKKVHGFADKLRIFMKDFNAIMFPQSEGCLSSKKPEEKKQEDVNEGLPPEPEIKQEIKQEEKPEAKPEAEQEFKAEQAINETEAKIKALAIEEKQNDNAKKEEKENIAKEKSLILPKESAAYEVAETKQTAHTAAAKQPKLKPAIIFILLVLCGVTVFLASKVKTLDEIQQQQSIEIKQLQEKLLAGNGVSAPKKVIIYIPFGNKVTK